MNLVCRECGRECKSLIGLKAHLRRGHSIKHEDYLIKYEYDGKRPTCECGCGGFPSYYRGKFKRYKQGHFLKKNHHLLYSEEALAKKRKTNQERYGGNTPMASEKVRNKVKQTNLKKYGCEHPMSSDLVKEKTKQTFLEKFGTTSPLKNKEVQKKLKQTNLKKYGVDNPSKNAEVIEKIRRKNLMPFEDIQKTCERKGYTPEFKYSDYSSIRDFLDFRCTKHDYVFKSSVFNIAHEGDFHQCPMCKLHGVSKPEKEIHDFVLQYEDNARVNCYDIITPKEIDVYIPNKKIGIEYHGLFWHSEASPTFRKNIHKEKFLLCQEQGIQLLQFFEDEWRDKQDICKSIILNKLGKTSNRIFARKCEVRQVEKHLEKEFIDNNHLQGHVRSMYCVGLFYENELKMVISVRKPFTKKHKVGKIEIARVCAAKNTTVVGGFSKLMKHIEKWAREQKYISILTYSDCRYSTGETYRQYGFDFLDHTVVDYFYTDGMYRYNRFRYRAQPGKPEKQVAEENQVHKVFGTGNFSWEKQLHEEVNEKAREQKEKV